MNLPEFSQTRIPKLILDYGAIAAITLLARMLHRPSRVGSTETI